MITGDFRTDTDTWKKSNILDLTIVWSMDFSSGPVGFKTIFEDGKDIGKSQHFKN
jgi:hypothetical protein